VKNVEGLKTNFWRETPESRRAALFPFIWGEMAKRGQIYGNQRKGSTMAVSNGKKFSYPGYSEMLVGYPDSRIDSNDMKPNPNVTVFEWLGGQPGFRSRVVAFGTWDAFPYIFNHERSGIPIWPPWELKMDDGSIRPSPVVLRLIDETTPLFEGMILDSFLFDVSTEYIQQKMPRLTFLGYGETDEWAHAGRYDLYLESAHNVDRFAERLWRMLQQISQYRDTTTLIISTDHGRGSGLSAWKDHGEKIDGAEGIWLAVMGPDTPALGERTQTGPITQSQIAATIAALVGQNFCAAFPKAAPPIAEILGNQLRPQDSKGE
jgi:hypothetical protein